jgi:hypothetical protein
MYRDFVFDVVTKQGCETVLSNCVRSLQTTDFRREGRSSTTIFHEKTQGGIYSVGEEGVMNLVCLLRSKTQKCDIVAGNCRRSVQNTHFVREGRDSTTIFHEKNNGQHLQRGRMYRAFCVVSLRRKLPKCGLVMECYAQNLQDERFGLAPLDSDARCKVRCCCQKLHANLAQKALRARGA